MNDDLFSPSQERFPRWLIVAGVCLVVGLVAMTYGVMQLFDTGESVEIIRADEPTAMSQTETPSHEIKVDIGGAVEHPGLYEMQASARVADVIEKAGGLTSTAHIEYVSKQLNLAEVVSDGQKLYIPFQDESFTGTSTGGTVKGLKSGQININTATLSELDSLVGIGESRAQKIIESRPYDAIEELVSKGVLSQSVFDNIAGEIGVR